MNITTLQNDNRQIELTPHECDILKQVATYLRDHFNDLEFSLRNFSLEESQETLNILDRCDSDGQIIVTLNEADMLEQIFSQASELMDDTLFNENEDLEDIPDDFFRMLFENLGTAKFGKGLIP